MLRPLQSLHPNKKIMKSILLTALFISFSLNQLIAQDNYTEVMRSVLSTEKKAAVAEVMALSEEEGKVFWPIYNEYQTKLYSIGTKDLELINDFIENYENMDDVIASSIMTEFDKVEAERVKLRKAYVPKFTKAIGAKKTLTYFQTENKITALINYELAQSIPLLK